MIREGIGLGHGEIWALAFGGWEGRSCGSVMCMCI